MIRRRRPRYYKGEFKDILNALVRRKTVAGLAGEFEKEFARYIGTKFAVATSSGRSALGLVLNAIGLKYGDEVIMPAYTLKDLVLMIQSMGFVPRLVDISRDSFNMDPTLIEGAISPRSKVIIATHLFGLPSDMAKIVSVARKHRLKVVEDCAHALGASLDGRRVGSLADAAFFSFETTKSINAFGGGMITTDDPDIAGKAISIVAGSAGNGRYIPAKIFFSWLEDMAIQSPLYPVVARAFINPNTALVLSRIYIVAHDKARVVGGTFTNPQALLALCQLRTLDERNMRRDKIAAFYKENLDRRISVQQNIPSGDRIFYFFVVKLPIDSAHVEKMRGRLIRAGVDCGIKSEITDNCAICLGQEERYPVTKEVYESAIQLPMHDGLTERDVSIVADAVNRCLAMTDS